MIFMFIDNKDRFALTLKIKYCILKDGQTVG